MHRVNRIAEISEENIGHLNDVEALTCALYYGRRQRQLFQPKASIYFHWARRHRVDGRPLNFYTKKLATVRDRTLNSTFDHQGS
jgi:hypothetical protein